MIQQFVIASTSFCSTLLRSPLGLAPLASSLHLRLIIRLRRILKRRSRVGETCWGIAIVGAAGSIIGLASCTLPFFFFFFSYSFLLPTFPIPFIWLPSWRSDAYGLPLLLLRNKRAGADSMTSKMGTRGKSSCCCLSISQPLSVVGITKRRRCLWRRIFCNSIS